MAPDGFVDIGIRLDLLLMGWISLTVIAIGLVWFGACMWFEWDEFGIVFSGILTALGVVGGVVWLLMLIPYDSTYHHLYRVEGTVTSVSNVLSDADGDLTRQPVITLDTVDRPIVIDDARAVKLEGAAVTLKCTVNWEYQAADRYECRVIDFGTAVQR